MKKLASIFFAVVAVFCFTSCCEKQSSHQGDNWKMVDGFIVVDEPAPQNGQMDMLGFAAEPIKNVRTGFVGLGSRGTEAVNRFTYLDGASVVALCDKYPDQMKRAQSYLERSGRPAAAEYSGDYGWKELCERDDIDLVYIATGWQLHVEIAVYAMEHGKHVAIEVPAATSIEECWRLVDTSERTRKHCMMLENCVYDFFELTCLNMAQQGLFGEVIVTEGAYIHNLSKYWTEYVDNWRLSFNQAHSGDVYPTHGFGPCCQVLNIHRGDRLDYLVSMGSPSVIGAEYGRNLMDAEEFAEADHNITLVKTENGKVMHIQHNVYTPRPYSRLYQLTGTKGYANKYPIEGILLENETLDSALVPAGVKIPAHEFLPEVVKENVMQAYKHPIHKEVEEVAKRVGGHGGMDYVMDYRLIYCLNNGLPLDQDVYDAAEWSSIGELSALSQANNGAPVKVPDFTRGKWNKLDGLKFYYGE